MHTLRCHFMGKQQEESVTVKFQYTKGKKAQQIKLQHHEKCKNMFLEGGGELPPLFVSVK